MKNSTKKDTAAEYELIKSELEAVLAGDRIYNKTDLKHIKDRAHRSFGDDWSEVTWETAARWFNTPYWHQFPSSIKKITNFKELSAEEKNAILAVANKWQEIALLFEQVLPLIVAGRKPGERKKPARTLKNTGTCAICGQNVKLDIAGKIVNHGYIVAEREFKGYCEGWGRKPWEISPQGAIDYITNYLTPTKLRLEKESKIFVWSVEVHRRIASDLGETLNQISYFEKRVATWEKKELPSP
jgi:hypothetical protein